MTQSIPQIAPEQYEILSLLGQGGMSSVYLARQRDMDRMLAIKVLQKHLLFEIKSLRRFKNEASWTSKLQHPNIVTVYSLGVWEDQPFIAMEYVEGRTLGDIIRTEGPLSVGRVCNIGLQILSALAVAHAAGVVHRDLKPQNVMIVANPDGSETVKILDFGVAKLIDECREQTQKLTGTGVLIGSPLYMSPEQFKGEPIDGRSDLYAVSCILCEALLGKTPYKGDDILQLMQEHMKDDVPQFAELLPNHSVPREVERVIRKGMSKTPGQRYDSADEFSEALKIAFESRSTPARRMIPFTARTALIAVALCLAGVIAFVYFSRQQEPPVPTSRKMLQMNNEDLRQCLLNDELWDELIRRLKKDDRVENEGHTALVDACLKYADSIADPNLRAGFRAKALFRKMLLYLDYATLAQQRDGGAVSSEARRLSNLAEEYGLQSIEIVNKTGFVPDRDNALRLVYQKVGQQLNGHARYEEGRKALEQGIALFDKIGARLPDYIWQYHELERSAFGMRDWDSQGRYAEKTLQYLSCFVEGTWDGAQTLVSEAVDAVCVSAAEKQMKFLAPPAKILQLLDITSRKASKLLNDENRDSWLVGLSKFRTTLKSPEYRAKIFLQVGQHAYQRQDWSRAEAAYREALKAQLKAGKGLSDPQRIVILFHIAQCLTLQEKFEQADRFWREIVRDAPPLTENLNYFISSILGICNDDWVAGRYEKALSAFDYGLVELKKFPASFERENARAKFVHNRVGYLIRLGRHADVVKELAELQKVIPDQYVGWKAATAGLMTESYVAMRQFENADIHCKATMEYVERQPALDGAHALLRIINYFNGTGEKERAERVLLWLRELATRQLWSDVQFACLVNLARCCPNAVQATQYLEEASNFADTNQVGLQGSAFACGSLVTLGDLMQPKNPELAMKYYKQAIKTGAATDSCRFFVANGYGSLGTLYSQRGKRQEAEKCFFEARRLFSANYRLDRSAGLTALAYAEHLQRSNDRKAAIALNKKLMYDIETPTLAPDQQDVAIAACKNLARIYTDEGAKDQAKKYTDHASWLEKK